MSPIKLYPHQVKALRYTLSQAHPALFLEMRLGKTLVTIRRICAYKPLDPRGGLKALIVAPNSALGSWEAELQREGINWARLDGVRVDRLCLLRWIFEAGQGWPVFALINKEGWLALPEIANFNWDAVVADESAWLKNPRAGVTKFFLRKFRDVPHRWILTGTPCPEGEQDYVCQMLFLRGNFLGHLNFWSFRAKRMEPDIGGYGWTLKPGEADVIRREIGRQACIMRRGDVGMERQKIYESRRVEMEPEQAEVYRKAERDLIVSIPNVGIEKRTVWLTAAWQWLRQIANGFAGGKLLWRGKIEELLELVRGELKGQQLVIWACFNPEVFALAEALSKFGLADSLTGEDATAARSKKVAQFQGGEIRFLVIQQAVAQTGLDLSAADTAIYFSSPVGQAARVQTEDRILSLRKRSPLLYIDLITRHTVDADVLRLVRDKSKMSSKSLSRALEVAMRERIKWTKN